MLGALIARLRNWSFAWMDYPTLVQRDPINSNLSFLAFLAQRGFAALDMSSDEMKCSDIVYNSSDFYSFQPIHVLLTINHGGQTNGLVHDVSTIYYHIFWCLYECMFSCRYEILCLIKGLRKSLNFFN